MKTRVQAQHLQIGDIVGSGETVIDTTIRSVKWPSRTMQVVLKKDGKQRTCYWGRYTQINVEREVTPLAWS